jgi:hypothetical protein
MGELEKDNAKLKEEAKAAKEAEKKFLEDTATFMASRPPIILENPKIVHIDTSGSDALVKESDEILGKLEEMGILPSEPAKPKEPSEGAKEKSDTHEESREHAKGGETEKSEKHPAAEKTEEFEKKPE